MRTTYVNKASPAFRFAAFRRDAALGFSPFLHRDLRTGAQRRNLHYAGSIPVLHFVSTLQVHRCAPPVLRRHYGRGKTHFLRPMNANPARRNLNPLNGRTRHHAAYFANCNQKRFTAPQLSELSITFGHPVVFLQSLRGEAPFNESTKPKKETRQ